MNKEWKNQEMMKIKETVFDDSRKTISYGHVKRMSYERIRKTTQL